MLNDFANFVNDYKTKHKISIFFIMRRSKTIITILEVIVSTSLVDIIVLVLSLKKRNQSSKTIENALMSKKRNRSFKIKTTINNKKGNDVKTSS